MKIVLDTNILLVSIPKKSPYRIIFNRLLEGQFDLIISNEILSEYSKIIAQKTNEVVANNISEMLLTLSNVKKQDVYYKWNLIEIDQARLTVTDYKIIKTHFVKTQFFLQCVETVKAFDFGVKSRDF
jgi:predicted nucleic acid-binding protein